MGLPVNLPRIAEGDQGTGPSPIDITRRAGRAPLPVADMSTAAKCLLIKQLSKRKPLKILVAMSHILRGRTGKEIAYLMKTTPQTVGCYANRVRRTLGVYSSAQVISLALTSILTNDADKPFWVWVFNLLSDPSETIPELP